MSGTITLVAVIGCVVVLTLVVVARSRGRTSERKASYYADSGGHGVGGAQATDCGAGGADGGCGGGD